MILRLALPLLLVVVPACAAGTSSGDGSEPGVRRSPYVLTTEEIRASPTTNLMDLIQRERPLWFRMRDKGSWNTPPADIVVYLDGSRFGTHHDLGKIQNSEVTRIRFLDARLAVNRYGYQWSNGAIEVYSTD